MSAAIAVLECKAYQGDHVPTHVRIGMLDDMIFLDLGGPDWRIARVTRDGCTIAPATAEDPVRFVRPRGVQALPEPVRGGHVTELRELWPQLRDDQWSLIVGWLFGCLRPGRPAPVLITRGEQDSGKSTLSKQLRRAIDPNMASLRSPPRNERDLVIAARNALLVGFENVSHIRDDLSDAICRLATGGGYGTRELYSDAEETLFDAIRPVLLNGIGTLAERPDLLDRSILINVPPLEDTKRLDEDELEKRFEAMRPRLLGVLLDAAVIWRSAGSTP